MSLHAGPQMIDEVLSGDAVAHLPHCILTRYATYIESWLMVAHIEPTHEAIRRNSEVRRVRAR